MSLKEYLNKPIRLLITFSEQRYPMTVILRGVENGGIWVESQELTEGMLELVRLKAAPKTPVLFLPYSSIACAIASIETPALSDKALE